MPTIMEWNKTCPNNKTGNSVPQTMKRYLTTNAENTNGKIPCCTHGMSDPEFPSTEKYKIFYPPVAFAWERLRQKVLMLVRELHSMRDTLIASEDVYQDMLMPV